VTQTSQMTVEIMTDVICSALCDVERFRTVIPSSNMTSCCVTLKMVFGF
jgi:hypothetical protein